MEEESPLDLLLDQIRWAEARRKAAEEELDMTPTWRFRERARRQRRFERRLAEKQQTMAFAAEVTEAMVHRQTTADGKLGD